MTARHRLAAPVAIVYGLMLVVGLALYSITRDDTSIAPLWVGSLLGTALGIFLALRDFRAWVAILVIVGIPCWCAPFAPPPLADENVWLAFIPAALCAFWSLGDRAALAAFWYPTVLWMLTVLDRMHGTAIPEWAAGRGFEVSGAGVAKMITGVEIVGEDSVAITVANDLSGLSVLVGYAATAEGGMPPADQPARWGHLRDSDPFVGAVTGLAQPNYCVAFQLTAQ